MTPAPVDPTIDLAHHGVHHAQWRDVLRRLEAFRPDPYGRLVVVAPHPDDETLGAGGLIAETSARGTPVLVVSITDGEAAWPEQDLERPLAERRHGELLRAMARLGTVAPVAVNRWQLPDGGLAGLQGAIATRLDEVVRPGDLVVGPLPCDGHPDHDAVGAAVLSLADDPRTEIGLFPVWAWHWHDPDDSVINWCGRRLDLSVSAMDAKREALAMFVSQTSGDEPILPEHFLQRFDEPFEVLVRP